MGVLQSILTPTTHSLRKISLVFVLQLLNTCSQNLTHVNFDSVIYICYSHASTSCRHTFICFTIHFSLIHRQTASNRNVLHPPMSQEELPFRHTTLGWSFPYWFARCQGPRVHLFIIFFFFLSRTKYLNTIKKKVTCENHRFRSIVGKQIFLRI